MTEPLTPAQVEMLEQRQEEQEALIKHLQDQLAQLQAQIASAVMYGQKLTLRTQKGVTLCVADGGPAVTEQPITWQSRTGNGPWESFTTERGQA